MSLQLAGVGAILPIAPARFLFAWRCSPPAVALRALTPGSKGRAPRMLRGLFPTAASFSSCRSTDFFWCFAGVLTRNLGFAGAGGGWQVTGRMLLVAFRTRRRETL